MPDQPSGQIELIQEKKHLHNKCAFVVIYIFAARFVTLGKLVKSFPPPTNVNFQHNRNCL